MSNNITSVNGINGINGINDINDITNVMYINLESRPDRNSHIISQLSRIGFKNYERFNAIKTQNGAIGCSMSHLKCLEQARDKGLTHLLICEDDTLFLNPSIFLNQFNTFLSNNRKWDVVLLAGNNVMPFSKIDDTCIRVTHCQTTTCYLVNGSYFNTLIDNFRDGLNKLMHNTDSRGLYAIDRYWLRLQQRDHWYLITPLTVVQAEGYSDIEQRFVNYTSLMTSIDKNYNTSDMSKFNSSNLNSSKFNMKNIVNKSIT
jgi:glycosyl transferase family 25